MGDRMRPITFEKIIDWINAEWKNNNSIFGIHGYKFYYSNGENTTDFLGEKLSIPIGPAAGPNSQLAQNIVSSYLTGSRFIELKTVQIIDGEDLPVSKPCIKAEDECYNVEWSTELRVEEAYEEYVKAWLLINILQKELGLSLEKDFIFNMSVGYDLDGIKSTKINSFIENMKDASNTEIWRDCKEVIRKRLNKFANFKEEDLEEISPRICSSITLSTLHGCPPAEIERIATYLLREKHLNTFIKMNPTLLGEDFVRDTFHRMGYGYITLNSHHFKNDLQYEDAIAMLRRLKAVAQKEQLNIGVKLTNTLPVKIMNKELHGEEMYMSGRALYPLAINLAHRLAEEFQGHIYISYSGGADFFNIDKIFQTGICPITFATTILKPGGYERITQLARKLEGLVKNRKAIIDVSLLNTLAKNAFTNDHHRKGTRTFSSRKIQSKLPLNHCAIAPCRESCPIKQRIPDYISLVEDGRYEDAFKVIVRDNPCPSITGSICSHHCEFKCTRLDYESSLEIRAMKYIAANESQDKYTEEIIPSPIKTTKKVCIIGAGAAGLATAAYLRRNGIGVQVFEKRQKAYGVISHIIPEFRISKDIINRDFDLIKKYGVDVNFGVDKQVNLEHLKEEFEYVVLAVGANKEGQVKLEDGCERIVNAVKFLENYNNHREDINLGSRVCVIGGGDVAMDAARAAKRISGVEEVTIIYRRTKEFMPASREEIHYALEDGVIIKELLIPVKYKNNTLICEEMKLGERDESGRRRPIATGRLVEIPATALIAAVGDGVDTDFFKALGIEVTEKGLPKVNSNCETNIPGVYVAGDALKGPGTIVGAMGHGKIIAMDIINKEKIPCDLLDISKEISKETSEETAYEEYELCGKALMDTNLLYERKGILTMASTTAKEGERCLGCNKVCELCVDVCPNRANLALRFSKEGREAIEILHIDGMCNECGNCGVFCPHEGNPYKDKITLFWTLEDLEDSTNIGFYLQDLDKRIFIVRNPLKEVVKINLGPDGCSSCCERKHIPKEMVALMETCLEKYSYLFLK